MNAWYRWYLTLFGYGSVAFAASYAFIMCLAGLIKYYRAEVPKLLYLAPPFKVFYKCRAPLHPNKHILHKVQLMNNVFYKFSRRQNVPLIVRSQYRYQAISKIFQPSKAPVKICILPCFHISFKINVSYNKLATSRGPTAPLGGPQFENLYYRESTDSVLWVNAEWKQRPGSSKVKHTYCRLHLLSPLLLCTKLSCLQSSVLNKLLHRRPVTIWNKSAPYTSWSSR
jgi:hypothetical protein